MFFLIGGVQPKTVSVDDTPRLCPACGLAQARLKRIDHYLSLFFIPLFPVKRGEPVVICDRCGVVSSPNQGFGPAPSRLASINQVLPMWPCSGTDVPILPELWKPGVGRSSG